jgi:outer membrane protein assembly factor BamA
VGPRNLTPRIDVAWPSAILPLLDYSIRDNPERWVPTGGDTSAVANIELVMPLPALGMKAWDGWAGAAFADIGNVWHLSDLGRPTSNQPQYAGDIPFLRYGIGGGMRVATPVGPLQMDLAGNPQAAFSSSGRRVLLVEGWEEPALRFHLTLGALW